MANPTNGLGPGQPAQTSDFKFTEASRPDWEERDWKWTKKPKPDWKFGEGANDGGASLDKNHVEVDPYEDGRPTVSNYKLLISAIVPRPIGFCSTISKDGQSTNLAPFSYFQMVAHDPPIFVLGFSGNRQPGKDSLRNLVDVGECCINIISQHFIEAADSTSINAPHGVSEWAISGLHPAPCSLIKPCRVREAVFSVETKLVETTEFRSKTQPDRVAGVMAIVEGVRFWVREDATNEARDTVDPATLKPMSRLGGVTYATIGNAIEIPRLKFDEQKDAERLEGLIRSKVDGQ